MKTKQEETWPQAMDIERDLLAQLAVFEEARIKVMHRLEPRDFFKEDHALIYTHMKKLWDEGKYWDIPILVESLHAAGLLERLGGAQTIGSLFNTIGTTVGCERYADILIELTGRRTLAHRLTKAMHDVTNDQDIALHEIFGQVRAMPDDIMARDVSDVSSVKDLGQTALDKDVEDYNNGCLTARTGLKPFDLDLNPSLGGGFAWSEFCVSTAPPSGGKTSAWLGIMRGFVKQYAYEMPALYCHSEDSMRALMRWNHRAIFREQVHRGPGAPTEQQFWEGRQQAQDILGQMPLYFEKVSKFTPAHLINLLRTYRLRHGVRFVVIDRAEFLEWPGKKKMHERIGDGLKMLSDFTEEQEMVVVLISHMNRSVNFRDIEDSEPTMGDFYGSGDYERDARCAVAFHNVAAVYEKMADRAEKMALVSSGKKKDEFEYKATIRRRLAQKKAGQLRVGFLKQKGGKPQWSKHSLMWDAKWYSITDLDTRTDEEKQANVEQLPLVGQGAS